MSFSNRTKHLLSLLLLTIVAVFMLGANPISQTIAPFDMLQKQAGWQNVVVDPSMKHTRHSDVLDYKLPAWRYARSQLRQGKFPVWNPLLKGGEPAAQLVTRSIITPAFLVYALIEDEANGLYCSALINLLIMSFFAYALMYRIGGNAFAAIVGSIIYSYCGFNAAWFYWHHVNTSIWIPALLVFSLAYLQTTRPAYLVGVCLSSVAMLLGGFPTVAVYGYIALLLLILVWLRRSQSVKPMSWKPLFWLLVAGVLSLAIAAFALQPLAEQLARVDLSYRMGGSAFRSLDDLVLFVDPFAQGALTLGRTAYVGLFPLLMIVLGFYLYIKNRSNHLLLWGLMLVILIAPLAFGWLPMEFVRQIPLIGTSMISRLVIIMALGAAIVTTVVMAKSYRWLSQFSFGLALSLSVIVIFVQVMDQARVFKKLVVAVDNDLLFPTTQTIRHMQSSLLPLQSVVADRGFFVSGVMTNYGLAEWFAHGIRSKADKAMLEEAVTSAFVTPTAASFACDQINYENPMLNYLAIKYIACAKGKKSRPKAIVLFDTEKSDFRVSSEVYHLQPGQTLKQWFYWPTNRSVSNFLIHASPLKQDARIVFQLYKNHQLVTSTDCVELIKKQESYLNCEFQQPLYLASAHYQLQLLLKGSGGDAIRFPLRETHIDDLSIEYKGQKRPMILETSVIGYQHSNHVYELIQQGKDNKFSYKHYEPNVSLMDNKSVSGSAYYVSQLDNNVNTDYDKVTLLSYQADDVRLKYLGEKSGWLVIPMRFYAGWQAEVDGERVDVDLFLDQLPVIKIGKGAVVRYFYQPVQWYISLLVSFVGVLLLMVMYRLHPSNGYFNQRSN